MCGAVQVLCCLSSSEREEKKKMMFKETSGLLERSCVLIANGKVILLVEITGAISKRASVGAGVLT